MMNKVDIAARIRDEDIWHNTGKIQFRFGYYVDVDYTSIEFLISNVRQKRGYSREEKGNNCCWYPLDYPVGGTELRPGKIQLCPYLALWPLDFKSLNKLLYSSKVMKGGRLYNGWKLSSWPTEQATAFHQVHNHNHQSDGRSSGICGW